MINVASTKIAGLGTLKRGTLSQFFVKEVKHILKHDSVGNEDTDCPIIKDEIYDQERNSQLSKSKAQKGPALGTSSHKVFETCAVAENSCKVS